MCLCNVADFLDPHSGTFAESATKICIQIRAESSKTAATRPLHIIKCWNGELTPFHLVKKFAGRRAWNSEFGTAS